MRNSLSQDGSSTGIQGQITSKPEPVNLLFVDTSLENVDLLIEEVAANVQVIKIDSDENGIDKVSQTLDLAGNVGNVHIVSHADANEIQLGSSVLSTDTIADYESQLANWGDRLTDRADILFYGCSIAGNADGMHLVDRLSQITGADVAASTDFTGGSEAGGDWDLEYTAGDIETGIGFKESVKQNYKSIFKNVFSSNFSNLNNFRKQSQTSHGLNVVKDPNGAGNVLRAELRKGDNWKGRARAELIPLTGKMRFDTVYSYNFSTYSTSNSTSGETIAQWHEAKSTNIGPPLSLIQNKGTFELRFNKNATIRTKFKTGISVKPGQWMNWTFKLRWSKSGNGSMEAYSNGKKFFEYSGKNALQSAPPYMKVGIYKPSWKSSAGKGSSSNGEKVVVHFKNLNIVEGSSSPANFNDSKSVSIQEIPSIKSQSNSNNSSPSKNKSSILEYDAEDLKLSNYKVQKLSGASGQKVIGLSKNKRTGRAVYDHKGGKGTYDLEVNYYDQKEGVGELKVLLNGKSIKRWALNKKSGGKGSKGNIRRYGTIKGLKLDGKDRLTFIGKGSAKEKAFIDNIKLVSRK